PAAGPKRSAHEPYPRLGRGGRARDGGGQRRLVAPGPAGGRLDGLLGPPRAWHWPEGVAMSAFLRVEGLVRRFDGTVAVDRVSLGLERGELLALLGPSGS